MREIYQKAHKILLIAALFTVQIGHTDPINTATPNWKCTLQYRGGPGAACYYALTPNIDISTGLLWHFGLITGCTYCGYKKNDHGGRFSNTLNFVRTQSAAVPLIVRFHGHKKGNWGINIGLNLDFILSGNVYGISITTDKNKPDFKDMINCCGEYLKECLKKYTGKLKIGGSPLSEIHDASKVMASILVGLDYEFEGGSNFGIEYLHGLNSVIPLDKTWGNFNINFTFGYNLIPLFTE